MDTRAVVELPSDRITLREAARSLPSTRRGKRVSFSTLWRWSAKGLADGRRLPILNLGGGLYVSRAPLAAFAQPRGVNRSLTPPLRTAAQRRRAESDRDRQRRNSGSSAGAAR